MSEKIFLNGNVYTADAKHTVASALGVRGGKIVFVGDESAARAALPGAETVDLAGGTLMPAFFEGHCHYAFATAAVVGANMASMNTAADYAAACARFLRENPQTKCLRGQGYLEACFPGRGPDRRVLDAVSRDIPIVLLAETLHSLWANTKAIEFAGITADTPDPKNGHIERDDSGVPSGCFRESAQKLILNALPPLSVADYKRGILAYQSTAQSLGFCGSFDAWIDAEGPAAIEALKELDAEGKLSMRFRGAYVMDPLRGVEQTADTVARHARDNGGKLFRMDFAKFFLDGILESYTSYLLEPYVNCPGYPKGWRGDKIWDDDNLRAVMAELDRHGISTHMHCYGDAAVRQGLDAIEYLQAHGGRSDARHCITHVFLAHRDDIPRFKQLGVVAMLNSYWGCVDETYVLNSRNIGEQREAHSFPLQSFFASGAVTANASDYPITARPNPFVGIETGMTRVAPDNYHPWIFNYDDPVFHKPLWPEQAAGREDLLDSYTRAGAYASFLDGESGTLEVGKSADMIITDRDVLATPAEDVGTIKVMCNYFAGEPVFER